MLLAVLACTVIAPGTALTVIGQGDGSSFLVELDVCHSAAPALSSNGEMPCIGSTTCLALPSLSLAFIEPTQLALSELILSSSTEHPPRS